MVNCKKCNNQIPNRIEINGVNKNLHSRTYCLDCSPWGERKGYSLRKQCTSCNDATKHCEICDREYPKTKNNVCSSCRTLYLRKKTKEKAIQLLGGKCVRCEEKDCRVLTFHHLDQTKKKFELSIAWGKKDWNLIHEELKLCEILCSNCHLKEHSIEDKRMQKICEYYTLKGKTNVHD